MNFLVSERVSVVRVLLRLRDNNQLVLPNDTVLLTTTACGVDLVYWILWLSLGKLVLLGDLSLYIE